MKPLIPVFLLVSIVMVSICSIPQVELFECHFYLKNDVQELNFNSRMSLSYFWGYGYEMDTLNQYDIVELTWKGWLMAFLLIIGTPIIVTYRIALYKARDKNK